MTKELSRPTAHASTQAFPQAAPIVKTRFVTNRNSVGFARKKAQTISFVERGFEKVRPWSPGGGFSVVFMRGSVFFTSGIFLLQVGWEALVFGHFSQPLP